MASPDESEGQRRWRRRRRRLRAVVLGLALAVVAVGVLRVVPAAKCGSVNPFSDLRAVDGECVGITDGSFEFASDFREIQQDIAAENDWVAEQHETEDTPAVKIALLSTLTPTDTSPLNREQVRHSLEGAYVAQHRANRTRELGDPQPLVQLVLANEGSVQQGWERVTDQLIDARNHEIPLAIVMGQGISTARTTAAAEKLSDADIPMVTGATMADDLDNDSIPGLVRAAPSNTNAAKAIRHYLDNQEELRNGVLVYDTREADTFATSLQRAFETELDDYLRSSTQPFPGASVEQGGPEVFDQITQNVCLADTDMVFFAGRAPDFEVFLRSLGERPCRDERVTAVFVDLGPNPRGDEDFHNLLEDGNMTVLHATGYDPGWPRGEVEAPEGFDDFQSHFDNVVGGVPDALDDGYAATNHDSMATAVRAVRITNPWENAAPAPDDVREHLLLLNGVNAVHGATGTLHFNANRGGNPGGKHVPIVPLPSPEGSEPIEPYVTPIE